jgi:hypothetical protein
VNCLTYGVDFRIILKAIAVMASTAVTSDGIVNRGLCAAASGSCEKPTDQAHWEELMALLESRQSAAGFSRSNPLTSENLPPVEIVEGQPQFRLFVAGASGSGKTVFLASLYNQLGVASDSFPFYVEVEPRPQADDLEEKFRQICESDQNWPDATPDVSNYVFRCFHFKRPYKFPLFSFHYTDFPGGDLLRPFDQQQLDVRREVANAHSVVLLLDGRKILDALEGRIIQGHNIYEDLEKICQLATSCIGRPHNSSLRNGMLSSHCPII